MHQRNLAGLFRDHHHITVGQLRQPQGRRQGLGQRDEADVADDQLRGLFGGDDRTLDRARERALAGGMLDVERVDRICRLDDAQARALRAAARSDATPILDKDETGSGSAPSPWRCGASGRRPGDGSNDAPDDRAFPDRADELRAASL